jgi:hypothetical protein
MTRKPDSQMRLIKAANTWSLFPPASNLFVGLLMALAGLSPAHDAAAQTEQAGNTSGSAKAANTLAPHTAMLNQASAVPLWTELTAQQRQILNPLSATWDSMGDGQKRKWIALVQNYPALPAAEQANLQSRMAQWAGLKPRDRELARLNFSETKKLSPPDRAANWEAYQALSPEERDRLAARAPAKPLGAAPAIKPTTPDKLTVVPVTRHTPQQLREMAQAQHALDRKTLLPTTPQSNAPK